MKGAAKFPFVFDVMQMLADVERIERDGHWLDMHDMTIAGKGDWSAIPLVTSTTTDVNDPRSLRYLGNQETMPTEALKNAPYLARVIETFKTRVIRARLMNMKPGTVIKQHRDYGHQRFSLERGFIRVHVPIRTHDKVAWKLRGERIPMEPGEAWYLNVCLPHAVENLSDVRRVHLVMDMKVNRWVLENLPPLSLRERVGGVFIRTLEPPFQHFKTSVLSPCGQRARQLGRRIRLNKLKRFLLGESHPASNGLADTSCVSTNAEDQGA